MAVSLQAQILALRTAVEATLTGTSEGARAPEVPWTPGQRLTAQVEAELPGGRYQIRVGTFQFDVELPVKAQVGDALRLEFVSASPRVAFALTPILPGGACGGGPGAGRLPQVQISAAGRVLTEVLQTGPAVARPAATAPPPSRIPYRCCRPRRTRLRPLAAALKGALDRSGLFYESHLVQWFAGDRPLAALLREPQGRLSTAAHSPAARPDDPDPGRRTRRRPRSQSERVRARRRKSARGSTQPLDPQVLGQIRSQLDVIEQRQIVWQGQAWPGQALEWRIEEPPERDCCARRPDPLDYTPAPDAAAPGRSERGAGPERRIRARASGRGNRRSRRGAARRSGRAHRGAVAGGTGAGRFCRHDR